MALNDRLNPNNDLIHGRTAFGFDGTNTAPLKVNISSSLGILSTEPVKTIQTELFAAASVAASTQAISSTLSVASVKQATFFIFHGRSGSAAFGTNGTEYRIEGSAVSAGNDSWLPLASVLASSAVAATLASSGTHNAGTTVITILSGTAAVANSLYLFQTGTLEWMRSVSVSGTASLTILDGLTNAHAAGTISAEAELFPLSLNLESVTRVRAVINNNASGTTQAIAARIACITE